MLYVTILLDVVAAFIFLRWLGSRIASTWVQLVRDPAIALIHARSRTREESAANVALLLAPIAVIALLMLCAAAWGGHHFAKVSTMIAHSLGEHHEQRAIGASATAPVGTGGSARDGTPALRNVSRWAGRRSPPGSGKAGGGVSGGPLPGAPWSPAKELAPAPARAAGCASRAACSAESHALEAWKLCAPLIEKAAPPHRWAKTAADMHFNAFSAEDATASIITYSGNGMLIRGSNGLWQRRAYSCAFDTDGGRALSARLMPVTHRLGP